MEEARAAVAAVVDPEVPVLTIEDLGVLRSVELVDGRVVATITPTWSGCPAMGLIERQVAEAVTAVDPNGEVRTVLSPAWTTDWITDAGRRKLLDYGIVPPARWTSPSGDPGGGVPVAVRRRVACPRCGSGRTEVVSEFGSTACKALYRCGDCLEPFDVFKEL